MTVRTALVNVIAASVLLQFQVKESINRMSIYYFHVLQVIISWRQNLLFPEKQQTACTPIQIGVSFRVFK
jgi:hypothetical protein